MAELIDKNALLKVLIHRVKGNEDNHIILGTNNTLSLLEEWVRSIPTVDAEEIVRCKDCRYYVPDDEYCGFWGACRHPEHFCGEGLTDNGR